jgi:hypothetical protein
VRARIKKWWPRYLECLAPCSILMSFSRRTHSAREREWVCFSSGRRVVPRCTGRKLPLKVRSTRYIPHSARTRNQCHGVWERETARASQQVKWRLNRILGALIADSENFRIVVLLNDLIFSNWKYLLASFRCTVQLLLIANSTFLQQQHYFVFKCSPVVWYTCVCNLFPRQGYTI